MEMKNIIRKGAFGLLAVFASNVVIACLIGLLVWKEIIPEMTISVVSNFVFAVVVITVFMITANKMPKSKLPVLLSMAVLNFALGQLLSAAVKYDVQSKIGAHAAIPVVAAVVAGLLSSRKRSKRKR